MPISDFRHFFVWRGVVRDQEEEEIQREKLVTKGFGGRTSYVRPIVCKVETCLSFPLRPDDQKNTTIHPHPTTFVSFPLQFLYHNQFTLRTLFVFNAYRIPAVPSKILIG